MSEINDAAVEAVRTVLETTHGYTLAPMPLYTGNVLADAERRYCDCGASFLTAQAHREHVYRAALAAALPYLTPEPKDASVEEVSATIRSVTDLWDEPLGEAHDVPPIANALLARFNITPKETN